MQQLKERLEKDLLEVCCFPESSSPTSLLFFFVSYFPFSLYSWGLIKLNDKYVIQLIICNLLWSFDFVDPLLFFSHYHSHHAWGKSWIILGHVWKVKFFLNFWKSFEMYFIFGFWKWVAINENSFQLNIFTCRPKSFLFKQLFFHLQKEVWIKKNGICFG